MRWMPGATLAWSMPRRLPRSPRQYAPFVRLRVGARRRRLGVPPVDRLPEQALGVGLRGLVQAGGQPRGLERTGGAARIALDEVDLRRDRGVRVGVGRLGRERVVHRD